MKLDRKFLECDTSAQFHWDLWAHDNLRGTFACWLLYWSILSCVLFFGFVVVFFAFFLFVGCGGFFLFVLFFGNDDYLVKCSNIVSKTWTFCRWMRTRSVVAVLPPHLAPVDAVWDTLSAAYGEYWWAGQGLEMESKTQGYKDAATTKGVWIAEWWDETGWD